MTTRREHPVLCIVVFIVALICDNLLKYHKNSLWKRKFPGQNWSEVWFLERKYDICMNWEHFSIISMFEAFLEQRLQNNENIRKINKLSKLLKEKERFSGEKILCPFRFSAQGWWWSCKWHKYALFFHTLSHDIWFLHTTKMFVWLHVMQYSYQFCSFISFVMKIEQTSTLRAIRNHFTGSFFHSFARSFSFAIFLVPAMYGRICVLVSNSLHINNWSVR